MRRLPSSLNFRPCSASTSDSEGEFPPSSASHSAFGRSRSAGTSACSSKCEYDQVVVALVVDVLELQVENLKQVEPLRRLLQGVLPFDGLRLQKVIVVALHFAIIQKPKTHSVEVDLLDLFFRLEEILCGFDFLCELLLVLLA